MHWTALRDYPEVAELLIRSGADVNAKDKVSSFGKCCDFCANDVL